MVIKKETDESTDNMAYNRISECGISLKTSRKFQPQPNELNMCDNWQGWLTGTAKDKHPDRLYPG